jgi:hypothetical protein
VAAAELTNDTTNSDKWVAGRLTGVVSVTLSPRLLMMRSLPAELVAGKGTVRVRRCPVESKKQNWDWLPKRLIRTSSQVLAARRDNKEVICARLAGTVEDHDDNELATWCTREAKVGVRESSMMGRQSSSSSKNKSGNNER